MIYTMYINFKEDVQGRAIRLYPSRSQVYPATQTWRQLFGPTVTQKCWWKRRTPSTPTIIIPVPWLSHIPFRAKFLLPSKLVINCLDWESCKSVNCWWKRRTPSSPTIIILIPWLSISPFRAKSILPCKLDGHCSDWQLREGVGGGGGRPRCQMSQPKSRRQHQLRLEDRLQSSGKKR